MRVELHSHTHHSRASKVLYDGIELPEVMVKQAAAIGLGAIAITDHDTLKGVLEAKKFEKKYNIIVVPGQEVTSADGHILAIGVTEAVPSGMTSLDTIDAIHDSSGAAISSHPFDLQHMGLGELCKNCDAVEIFNAINLDRLSNKKSERFARLHNLIGVANSDAHCKEMIGNGTVNIEADDIDGIVKAIRGGKVEIATRNYTPMPVIMRWSVTRLQMSYPYTMKYVEENYWFMKRVISKHMLGLVTKSPGYIDWFFKSLSYFGLGSVMTYSAMKAVKEKVF